MHRKTIEEKKLAGTFKQSKERARLLPEDPEAELRNAKELLAAMYVNMRLAGEALRKYGMTVELARLDTHRNIITVVKSNPALKIQRDAMRTLTALKAEIKILEELAAVAAKKCVEATEWVEFLQ